MQDIHTHLYWESFDSDREEVLMRAKEAGVTEMLVVGTTVEESMKAIKLARDHESLFATVGIHPNEARVSGEYSTDNKTRSGLEELNSLLQEKNKKVVAVGECGLDYSESHGVITESEKQSQKKLFKGQIDLATQYNLPLIVHCRAVSAQSDEAYWDLLVILKEVAPKLSNIILHCYMGSVSVTQEFLTISNIYFSFTGNITYPVKQNIQGGEHDLTKVVKTVPLEKIFVETDCPFLAPQEYRGKRNEPAFVIEIAKKVAEIHQLTLDRVEQKTAENFKSIFRLG